MHNDVPQETTGTGARAGAANTSGLARLGELGDYRIAEGDPDIRGWDVGTLDGRKIGKVDDLVVDTTAMRVRYLEVEVDRHALGLGEDRHVLVPLGTARLDEDSDTGLIDRLPSGGLTAIPPYSRGQLTDEYEESLRNAYGYGVAGTAAADFYGHELYDDRRFWTNRRPGSEGTPYITRAPKGAYRR
jgi:photosynthetic reaction center H subunit